MADAIPEFRIDVRYGDIPAQYVDAANGKRAELIETLADVDEAIADAWLEEREISPEELVVRPTAVRVYDCLI